MKTVAVTLHYIANRDSSLQAFALQHSLKGCEIDNEIINHVSSYTQNIGHPMRTFAQ